jgi:type IV secretory pathway VirB4 component
MLRDRSPTRDLERVLGYTNWLASLKLKQQFNELEDKIARVQAELDATKGIKIIKVLGYETTGTVEEICQTEVEMQFMTNRIAFENLLPELLKDPEKKGRYVVIWEGKEFDSDKNKFDLAERMIKTVGKKPFYIGQVVSKRKILDLPSPERLV